MADPKTERTATIADVRARMADAVNEAVYADGATVMTRRGVPVAVVVSYDFYVDALERRGETRVKVSDNKEGTE